jgi:hypothetical protein
MNPIVEKLDNKLCSLDPAKARELESLVEQAIDQVEQEAVAPASAWPKHYFEQTAGALAGETFDRPPQGELSDRDDW